jgi:protein SCO1
MRFPLFRITALLLLSVSAWSAPPSSYEGATRQAARQSTPVSALAPPQLFKAVPAGTYDLPAIQAAGDGWVLNGNWLPRRLSTFTHERVTLLSFVYTYCSDPIGCPLIYSTMQEVKRRVVKDVALGGQVRFVSLSFDPTNDTPSAMQFYGSKHANDRTLEWHFLTTYSPRFLKPILDEYGQDVEIETDEKGVPTRAISHMVKLFLIDEKGRVREIYSTAFLHPDVIHNDIKTLVMESTTKKGSALNTMTRQ